mmetsp:Transcript_34574/g.64589  ORF Transcript_34574/g.64589 Transcript_34574/m.64589 type:complete len:737 (-) Transcript_34574:72-2282(-)
MVVFHEKRSRPSSCFCLALFGLVQPLPVITAAGHERSARHALLTETIFFNSNGEVVRDALHGHAEQLMRKEALPVAESDYPTDERKPLKASGTFALNDAGSVHKRHHANDVGHASQLHHSGDASHAHKRQGSRDPADISQEGAVEVVDPVTTESEKVKLEELTEECLQDEPTSECMEKFGSYGIRKIYTEDFEALKKLGQIRPGWMSHPEVQKKKLFELVLPGSVNSATYAFQGEDALVGSSQPYGVVSQNMNIYQQLEMGIRAFDLKVAWSAEASMVYVSHRVLMIPLAVVLRDMRRFLEEHEREVIVVNMKKDIEADEIHLRPLTDEEKQPDRIPGQLVHETVECEMKEMLAIYDVINKLPSSEKGENPTIGGLTDIGAHVVYFWDGQQVLCSSFERCKTTPGWYPAGHGEGEYPFAFGPPFKLGERVNATGGRTSSRIFEPSCIAPSEHFTSDDQPEQLLKKIKIFVSTMTAKVMETRPLCFPVGATVPLLHEPTLWYSIQGFVVNSPEENKVQEDRMRGVKAIYTRGEGFTVKTEAERTNYLLLAWFLKRNNQEMFTKPNSIMFEFIGSAATNILRIIEAMQARPECGFAIYCKDSGSCWADTLLGIEDTCTPEDIVLKALKDHAEGFKEDLSWVIYLTLLGVSCLCLCAGSMLGVWMYKQIKGPTPKKPDGEDEKGEEPNAEMEGEVTEIESTLPDEEKSDIDSAAGLLEGRSSQSGVEAGRSSLPGADLM